MCPLNPLQTPRSMRGGEAKLIYEDFNIRLGKAKICVLKFTLVFIHLTSANMYPRSG